MSTGRWMGRASVEAGAAEWGVSEDEIARDAGEASRLIAGVLTSDAELRSHLEGMIATAARMAADEGGARGATALIQAAQTWARLRGVDAPVRVAGPAAERAQLVEALRAPSPELRGILADAGLLVAREGDEGSDAGAVVAWNETTRKDRT